MHLSYITGIGRFVRKTKCDSKMKPELVNAVGLFQFYWNIMDRLPKRGTQAMIENLIIVCCHFFEVYSVYR